MAPEEKSSGFFFDVQDWRGSRSVQRMSMAERGVYKEMLNEQWEKRSLPDSAEAVADLIAVTPSQAHEVIAAWPVVRRNFEPVKNDPTRIVNVKLERVRRQQRENRRKHQTSGALGGIIAAVNRRKRKALEASNAVAPLESAIAKTTDLTRHDLTRQDKEEDLGNQQQDALLEEVIAPYVENHKRRRRGFRIR